MLEWHTRTDTHTHPHVHTKYGHTNTHARTHTLALAACSVQEAFGDGGGLRSLLHNACCAFSTLRITRDDTRSSTDRAVENSIATGPRRHMFGVRRRLVVRRRCGSVRRRQHARVRRDAGACVCFEIYIRYTYCVCGVCRVCGVFAVCILYVRMCVCMCICAERAGMRRSGFVNFIIIK